MAGPICPWCGDEAIEDPESLPFDREGLCPLVCEGCTESIDIRRVVTVEYVAEKQFDAKE